MMIWKTQCAVNVLGMNTLHVHLFDILNDKVVRILKHMSDAY
jgi:hypothetical protein